VLDEFLLLLFDSSGWLMEIGVWMYTGGGGQGSTNCFFFTN
jgi:hypothetical protein